MSKPNATTESAEATNKEYDEMMARIEKELEDIYDIEDGENYCFQLSNDIVRLASHLIEDRHYERKSVQHIVDKSIKKMFSVMDVSIQQQRADGLNQTVCLREEG